MTAGAAGDSGDTTPYAVEREIEDLDALIREARIGIQCTASHRAPPSRSKRRTTGWPSGSLALYGITLHRRRDAAPIPGDFLARLNELVAAGRRSDAVKVSSGLSIRRRCDGDHAFLPAWSAQAVAHTPPTTSPSSRHQRGKPFSRAGGRRDDADPRDGRRQEPGVDPKRMRALAGVLPNATFRTLEGQTHMLKADAAAPVLTEFFST